MSDPVLQAAGEGLALVFSWPNLLYPIVGTLLAMVFSFLPGLSGVTLMALAIPFTMAWEPLPVMLLFGAFVGGATFMGSVTSILFNIPGRPSNAATLLDGYPLARQGQARTALGCSAAASALGSTFGIGVLILLIPFMRRVILAFGPAEFLMLAVWGLTTLGVLTRGSAVKGLIGAGLGLLLAFIGHDVRTAELRYTWGLSYLRDGLSLAPVFLGLFALAEAIELCASRRATISGQTRTDLLRGSVSAGVRSVFTHFGLFLRSSVIGTLVGMMPGIGASVAGFLAYGHAVQTSRRDPRFGRGDLRGVLAPEAALDAKDGGALVPTLAFGIPGGTGTAMLLAALALHGLTPGPAMMTTHLHLVFVLIWSLFFSNWLTSLLGLAVVSPLTRLTVLRTQALVPVILGLSTLGAYVYRQSVADVLAAYLFGALGYFMRRYDWPRVPLVIGLVLGPLFEVNLHLALRLQELGRIAFWSRPIVLALATLTAVSLLLPYLMQARDAAAQRGEGT
jgi:putative tricarboxylic transport membrane protein